MNSISCGSLELGGYITPHKWHYSESQNSSGESVNRPLPDRRSVRFLGSKEPFWGTNLVLQRGRLTCGSGESHLSKQVKKDVVGLLRTARTSIEGSSMEFALNGIGSGGPVSGIELGRTSSPASRLFSVTCTVTTCSPSCWVPRVRRPLLAPRLPERSSR